jgi:hypothetical protein
MEEDDEELIWNKEHAGSLLRVASCTGTGAEDA